ncbi:formylglycine-generating enzyme family protein [Sphaerothrix gracilis]|uniref:formylglycine-generating enzyme family protein n=1 Tax=Sphaerothrix gracilis TaxID=3151835 RepID=UPI0031FDFB87
MAQPTANVVIEKRRGQNQCFDEALSTDLSLRMMLIPGGEFLMGSPEDELERLKREGPQHRVQVPQFFMGKYPVTQAQWRFVAGLPQLGHELRLEPSRFKGDKRPVEQVSWYEAVEFCQRLAEYTKRPYRLPSEAEWEYACRAGTTTPFHFGETITTDLANYRGKDNEKRGWSGSHGDGPKGEHRKETTPVDYFDVANAFGLCDMHGNVWEWCEDHWHGNYRDAPEDGRAWLTDNKEAGCVRRGGSWGDDPRNCRSAYRYYILPGNRDYRLGFRVVCSAPGSLQ